MTTATPTTAPIELPELVALRARTEPIVLGVDVERCFEQLGFSAVAREQCADLRERSYDTDLPAADVQELACMESEINRLYESDKADFLALYRTVAASRFRFSGVNTELRVIDVSDVAGSFHFENSLIRSIAEQAHDETRRHMSGEMTEGLIVNPFQALAPTGFDYLTRAIQSLATGTRQAPTRHAATPRTTTELRLSEEELLQLAMLLGLVSARERRIAQAGDVAARRIEAVADRVLNGYRSDRRSFRH